MTDRVPLSAGVSCSCRVATCERSELLSGYKKGTAGQMTDHAFRGTYAAFGIRRRAGREPRTSSLASSSSACSIGSGS